MDWLFTIASLVAVSASLLTVTRRNPIYSVAWMMVALFALAVIFVLLLSTFLGVVQVLLYAGAILVLFVFVVMLLNPSAGDLALERPPLGQRVLAGVLAVVLLVSGGTAILGGDLGRDNVSLAPTPAEAPERPEVGPLERDIEPEFGGASYFARYLYDRYLIAFELVGLLLLAAMTAVMVIAKRRLGGEEEPGGAGPEGPIEGAGSLARDRSADPLRES